MISVTLYFRVNILIYLHCICLVFWSYLFYWLSLSVIEGCGMCLLTGVSKEANNGGTGIM